jgi:glycosyltransferase involved in cell wall biosynthesis
MIKMISPPLITDGSRPRVAVVYHFFAHYREAVFRALHHDDRCEWSFFADKECFDDEIKPATFTDDMRFTALRVRRIRGSVMWQSGVLRLAVSRDFDVIVLLGVPKYLAMWIAAPLARITGKRVLFWTHGWTYRPKGVLRYVRRAFLRLANAIMTYGRWAKQIAIEEGFDPRRVHVIGNSLDYEAQQRALAEIPEERPAKLRLELFGDSTTPVIVCPSRLTFVRRLDLLLEAAALLGKRGTPVNVILIGDGRERASLEALAGRLEVNVAFVGACYDERKIGELLLAGNVCVAPGKVGLTAMHAMAFGVPVVSHDDPEQQMPEFEAIIPGKTGTLFRPNDVTSLADAIVPWIAVPMVRPSTRAACREVIRRFWSPTFQVEAIVRAVQGLPANDLLTLIKDHTTNAHQACDT